MMRIVVVSLCLLAALCVAGQLETGMYDFTVDARKSGRAEPYHDALECILVATNGRVLITGQGDGGAPIRLSGVQTNGFISFKTLFPTGSVMQAMLMSNVFTGQVDTASSAREPLGDSEQMHAEATSDPARSAVPEASDA